MYLAPEIFANSVGFGVGAAQVPFKNAATGKPWKGFQLPVAILPGNRGGGGGKVWALHLEGASPDLLALLKLPDHPAVNGA